MQLLKNAMALFAVTSSIITAIILIAELVVYPWALNTPRDILLFGHAAQPGVEIDGQVINGMGFTGDVINHPKPEGTLRILVLGGSVMFNRQLGARLKTGLQKRTQKKIELLNAGLRSHSSQSDLYKMRYLAKYGFDYVIYYNGINELLMNAEQPMEFRDDYSHYDAIYRYYPIFDYSYTARLVYKLYYAAKKSLGEQTAGGWNYNFYNYSSIAVFERNLMDIAGIAKTHGSKLILTTFAYSIPDNYSQDLFREGRLGYINPTNYDKMPVEMWGEQHYVKAGLDRINATLKKVATNHQLALIDADHALSGKIHLFGDVCHFNDDGVDIFIDLVTTRFMAENWLQ